MQPACSAQGVKCYDHPEPPLHRQREQLLSALMSAQQPPLLRGGEACGEELWLHRAGPGVWEAPMHDSGAWLGDRLAPACAFTGIKALKKKEKRHKGVVFPGGGLTPSSWHGWAEVASGSRAAAGASRDCRYHIQSA